MDTSNKEIMHMECAKKVQQHNWTIFIELAFMGQSLHFSLSLSNVTDNIECS